MSARRDRYRSAARRIARAGLLVSSLCLSIAPARASELSDDLTARRARVMDRLGPDGILVMLSAPVRPYSLDVDYEYRQDSNLYYLTGVTQDETMLVLMPGNATRREILSQLARGDRTISQLAARFDMSLPAVSKHVRVLQHARLAAIRRVGRARRASLRAVPLRRAVAFIERYRQFWESELDLLAAYLHESSPSESSWPNPLRQPRSSKSAGRSGHRNNASSTHGRTRKS